MQALKSFVMSTKSFGKHDSVVNAGFELAPLAVFGLESQMLYQLRQTLRSLMAVSAYTSAFSLLVWMRLHVETFKHILASLRRLNFHFEQVPFQSMQTPLRYRHDRQTEGFSAVYSRFP